MKSLFCGFTFALLFACSQPAKQPVTDTLPTTDTSLATHSAALPKSIEDYYQPAGDSIILPSFSIQLNLSPKAEEKLKRSNETIVISADVEGKPKDTTDKFFQQWGYIVVGNSQIELTNERIATFNSVKISKAAYNSLAGKDVDVLIDVFSGRHSSQNNLLDCEFLQEPISKVRKQTNVLSGKLIGE